MLLKSQLHKKSFYKIENRVGEIIQTIYNVGGGEGDVDNWWFDGAKEGEVGDICLDYNYIDYEGLEIAQL